MKHVKYWFCSYFVTFGVVLLSVIPIPDEAPLSEVPLIDKWVHFVMYGGLALAVWFDGSCRNRRISGSACVGQGGSTVVTALQATLYPALLGGAMELVQAYLTTYRSGDWLDFVADCVGVALAFPFGIAFFLWRKRVTARSAE